MSKVHYFQGLIRSRDLSTWVKSCALLLFSLLTASVFTACGLRRVLHEKPERSRMPTEIAKEISPFKRFDRRPYELIWSKREEPRTPLVNFSSLAGWQATASPGTDAFFEPSQDKQLWGSYVGAIRYQGGGADSWIELIPPQPLPLKEVFDAAEIWVWTPPETGDGLAHAALPARLSIRLLDAENNRVVISYALEADMQWHLLRTVMEERPAWPCRLESLYVSGLVQTAGSTFYLDSLSFYKERLSAIKDKGPSNPMAQLLPGNMPDPGGRLKLVFPVDDHAVCPAPPQERAHATITRLSDTVYAIVYQNDTERLEYRIDLTKGIDDIRAYWNNTFVGLLTHKAGIEGFPNDLTVEALREENGELRIEYKSGVVLAFRLCGRTLQTDIICRGGEARALQLGQLAEVVKPRLLQLPFLRLGPDVPWPVYLVSMPAVDSPKSLFLTVLVDPYRSNASGYAWSSTEGHHPQMIYASKTDGRRNDLHERFYLTVSPRLEDVLPTLGRAPGAQAASLAPLVWRGFFGHRDSRTVDAADARLSQYGMTSMIFSGGRKCWSDQDDSFSFRTRAAPYQGGDGGLWSFLADYKELAGWKLGLYANFFEISPLNKYWNEAFLARDGHGQWISGSGGTFLTKPLKAAELGARIVPEILHSFNPDVLLLDLASISPPGKATDFDARLYTAGTFSHVYYTYGSLLRSISTGNEIPVVATGGSEWLYAGLVDAFVLKDDTYTLDSLYPLLPLFALGHINPLSCVYGPEFQAAGIPDASRALDRYIAMQIAYGMGGHLADVPDISLAARSYYMMQALQQRYLLSRTRRVAYYNGERIISPSEALAEGSSNNSQLYVHYETDLEVWVNGSASENWDIRIGREEFQLPPYGWAAQGPDFLELSVSVKGARIDYVRSPSGTYYDGRGSPDLFGGICAPGPVFLRPLSGAGGGGIEVMNIGSMSRIGLGPPILPREAVMTVEGFSAAGRPMPVSSTRDRDGFLWMSATPPVQRMVIRPGDGPSP